MKIAFLDGGIYAYASGAPGAVGGAERQQWMLARALSKAGSSVTVGVRDTLRTGDHHTIDGVEFVGLKCTQALQSWYSFLRMSRPDWWYWRCANHLWGVAVEMAHSLGVRTIFSTALDRDVTPRNALFWRRRWWPLYAWGLMRTDRIFVQHQGQLDNLRCRWQPKAYVIPNMAEPRTAIKSHSERERYVAWVAVLRQVKRPDRLIDIARRASNVRFVVCGGPSAFMSSPGYGELTVRQLKNVPNIEYLGAVAPDVASTIIANASIFLSTSDEEGFPNTFLQAWSSGTPVISLKIDPDRLIKRERLGAVVGDIDSAICEIRRLIDSPREREEISSRALRHAKSAHSREAVLAAFERGLRGVH
jgi:glycosyltransferase involved in cell wall biosynthesis